MAEPAHASQARWDGWWSAAEGWLAPLAEAGWVLGEDDTWGEEDEGGPLLAGTLRRTCTAVAFEFEPEAGRLTLLPCWDGEGLVDVLDDAVTVESSEADGGGAVEDVAGRLGLLDPTRVEAAPGSDVGTGELADYLFVEHVLRPAADHRGGSLEETARAWDGDRELPGMLSRLTVAGAGNVLPEVVPSAVALGIAAFCWRNDTDVEGGHHRLGDAQTAKSTIAAVRAVRDAVTLDGVDWDRVEEALCDPGRTLGDGRRIGDLFGDSWQRVLASVREQVRRWRGLDEDLLGPQATLVVLTLAGSTTYTDNWWGQGRWPAIVGAVVDDLAAAGLALPPPYHADGGQALLVDALTATPDLVPDDVWEWLIEPPVGAGEARGLRMTRASSPPVRQFTLFTE